MVRSTDDVLHFFKALICSTFTYSQISNNITYKNTFIVIQEEGVRYELNIQGQEYLRSLKNLIANRLGRCHLALHFYLVSNSM